MDWFTADEHYWHLSILELALREFKNIKQMHNTIIRNHNACVKPTDTTYHVGDMYWGKHPANFETIMKKLNGRHILILGNHEMMNPFKYIELGFESVHTSLDIGDYILNHDPSVSCINRNRIFICGHVHDLFKVQKNVINVGVDVWDYQPVSRTIIDSIMKGGDSEY